MERPAAGKAMSRWRNPKFWLTGLALGGLSGLVASAVYLVWGERAATASFLLTTVLIPLQFGIGRWIDSSPNRRADR